ncbi:MAG: DsbA family oxidoreductase, partial [Thermoleophilaceae bacterium]
MRIEIWSDVVCPWCFIGKRRLEAALQRFAHRDDVELIWRSFELDPGAPAAREGDYASRLAEKYGRSVPEAQKMIDSMAAAGAADGLDLRFDIARAGNTFDAHRLLHLAAERDTQGALKERLFQAYFTEGEAIADHDTLVRLAGEVGLEPTGVESVLGEGTYADAVRSDEERARRYGIAGVPFFVVDEKFGVSGA